MEAVIICLILLVSSSTAQQDDQISDELAYKWGQCPVPDACRVKCTSNVDCSSSRVGPSVPAFKYYVIGAREWKFNFSHNAITEISQDAFFAPSSGSRYVAMNFTDLDLSHNKINYISPYAFREGVTKALKTLDLSYNELEELKWGVFNDIPALERLDLSNNRLMSVDSLCASLFPALTVLNLNYNNLTYIQDGCFKSKPKLDCGLSFAYNSIFSMPICAVKTACDWSEESNNPLICPCSPGTSCIKPGVHNETSVESTNVDQSCSSDQRISNSCKNVTLSLKYPFYENGCLLKKDMFAVNGMWNSSESIDTFTVSLYKVQYVTDSTTNETSMSLFTEDTLSMTAANFTSIEYKLGAKEKWLFCVKESSGIFSTCKNLVAPNYWEVGSCNGAMSTVPTVSFLSLMAFFGLAKILL